MGGWGGKRKRQGKEQAVLSRQRSQSMVTRKEATGLSRKGKRC